MRFYKYLFSIILLFFIFTGYCNSAGTISAGTDYSLFVNKDGIVWAWGNNFSGKLGNGTNIDSNIPKRVDTITSIKLIEAGCDESFGIDKSGNLWVWGENLGNYLGMGKDKMDIKEILQPEKFTELENVVDVSSSCYHTLILKDDSTVYAWGENFLGQIGNYNRENNFKPYMVKELVNSINIAAGGTFSFAQKINGDAYMWGDNKYGQLGVDFIPSPPNTQFIIMPLYTIISTLVNYTSSYSVVPTKTKASKIISISAGNDHALALLNDGTVWAWGRDNCGQLGNGKVGDNESTNTPTKVLDLYNTVAISAGGDYSLALDKDGTVWAWGDNTYAQLGSDEADNKTNLSATPVKVKDLSKIKEISAGVFHSLALREDGTLWGWGRNNFGQLSGKQLEEKIKTPREIKMDESITPLPFYPPRPIP